MTLHRNKKPGVMPGFLFLLLLQPGGVFAAYRRCFQSGVSELLTKALAFTGSIGRIS
jgi:hypothetical protein